MKPLVTFLAAVPIVLIIGMAVQAQTIRKKMERTVDAKTLWTAFSTNNDKAAKDYSGEWVITGYASYVGPDPYALPSVEVTNVKGGKSQVMCVLPFSDYLKLRKVSKGDRVVIAGHPLGYYDKGRQVVTKQCQILEVNGKKQ